MVKLQYMMHCQPLQHHMKDMENVAAKLRGILNIHDISDDYAAVLEAIKVASNIITMLGNVASNLNVNDASNGNVNDASNGNVDEAVAELQAMEQDDFADGQNERRDEVEEELSDQSFYSDTSYASSEYFTETSGFISDDSYEMTDSSIDSYSELDESINW